MLNIQETGDANVYTKDDATRGAWQWDSIAQVTDATSTFGLRYFPIGTLNASQVLQISGNVAGSCDIKIFGTVALGSQLKDGLSSPGTAGQVLSSTGTGVQWVSPSGGVTKTARVDMGTIASATPSLVTTYNWPTSFADNNYTIVGSVVILETPPAGAATAIITVGSIELLANGTGFQFVVCNADGLPHHVFANFVAVHD